MKRKLLCAAACTAAALAAPELASANARPTTLLTDAYVAVGSPAIAGFNQRQTYDSVDSVCFDFTFSKDTLDPGEVLRITPLSEFDSLGGPAVSNPTTGWQGVRSLCVVDPEFTSAFLDGSESAIEFAMENGSVTIARVVVTINGTVHRPWPWSATPASG
jgi:hypothetical protein